MPTPFMSTTTPMGVEFIHELIPWIFARIQQETAYAYRIVWDAVVQLVVHNLGWVILALFIILALSAFEAFSTGRWGWFGSVFYHYFFGTIIIAIGFIWGPEVFANDYFELATFLVYIFCFWLVGKVLKKLGLTRRF